MSIPFKTVLLTSVACLVPCTAAPHAAQDRFQDQLAPFLTQTLRSDHLPGMALGIVQNGHLVYAQGFGVTTLEAGGIAVTPRTLFHLGSLTKAFIATCAMQLVEAGRVELDQPVRRYLPYFEMADGRARAITVRQMLTHTSGMPDVDDYEWDRPRYDALALEAYVRSLQRDRLLASPGAAFNYSNMAYEVLGDLIAKRSGLSVEAYVASHIFAPAQMHDSTLLRPPQDVRRVAQGYERGPDGMPRLVAAYPYNRAHTPSSNLLSSVEDMARWITINLARGRCGNGCQLLGERSYDVLWTAAADTGSVLDAGRFGAAMGWFVGALEGERVIIHGGSDDGFRANLILVPARALGVIYMTNADFDRRQRVSLAALRVALGRALDASSLPQN